MITEYVRLRVSLENKTDCANMKLFVNCPEHRDSLRC